MTAWKVEGNGLSKPSYLFGTVQQLYNFYWYVPELAAMFDAVDVIAADLDKEQLDAWWSLRREHGKYPEGDGLQKHIPAELYTRAIAAAEKIELPPSIVESGRPWFVNGELRTQYLFKQKMTSVYGSKLFVLERAKELGLEVVSLTSAKELLEHVTTSTSGEDVADLEAIVREIEKDDGKEVLELRTAWETGQIDTLERLYFPTPPGPSWDAAAEKMLGKIVPMMNQRSVLVAVDTTQVIGAHGLVEKLRRQGFTVEQLETKASR